MRRWDEPKPGSAERIIHYEDGATGLRAVLVIDSLRLGPGAGGIRRKAYASLEAAISDARALAAAMTRKCALAGLPAGGAKMVILDGPELQVSEAYRRLGAEVQALEGQFWTAGDLGTSLENLHCLAEGAEYVCLETDGLNRATAETVLACMRASVTSLGLQGLKGRSAAVQGCGQIGHAVAMALRGEGLRVTVADIDQGLAARTAEASGATVLPPSSFRDQAVDFLSPCAIGGVIDAACVQRLRAPVICGAANNILADRGLALALKEAGILWVPDVLASSGAVIHGVGRLLMGLENTDALIAALGLRCLEILGRSEQSGASTEAEADRMVAERLA